MRIQDRETAGRLLAPVVGRQDLEDPVVVGIGPGGLAVGLEIGRFLHCPVDMIAVVELDAGDALHPARSIGALSADGHVLVRPNTVEQLRSAPSTIRDAISRARSTSAGNLRARQSAVPTSWRSVVLVDDGTSSRDVVVAALDLVRGGRPGQVLLAMPVAPQEMIDDLSSVTGEVIVAAVAPWVEWFHWHGRLYEDDRLPSGEALDGLRVG